MIDIAKNHYPEATFTVGDATQLEYDDNLFDAVACSFGILHVDDPDKMIAEAYRVLRSGGRYAFTTWCTPADGGVFLELSVKPFKLMPIPMLICHLPRQFSAFQKARNANLRLRKLDL